MSNVDQWVRAFAKQSLSDFDAREQLLEDRELPQCHQLHALQMALEKASKAHLISVNESVADVTRSHAHVGKQIPLIVKHGLSSEPGTNAGWLVKAVRNVALRIDRLHPQINDGGSVPANVEYPWQGPFGVVAPCDHSFGFSIDDDKPLAAIVKFTRQRMAALVADPES